MKQIEEIKTKKDFIQFLNELSQDFYDNEDDWQNINLGAYLECMGGWLNDMNGRTLNIGRPMPENMDWQMIALMFLAAKYYE